MPSTVQNAVALLQAWSVAFQQHYKPGVSDFLRRHGKTTRIIPMRKERVLGNSIEYTVKAMHNRGTRVSMDPMADQPPESPGEYVIFTVNFDHTNSGTGNDFAVFEIAFSTTIFDIWKRSDRTFKDSPDFIRKDVDEGLADVQETFAKYIHLPATGRLGTMDQIRDDDDDRWDSAGVYTAGNDTALVKMDPGAIARFGPGQRIDLHLPGNTVALYSNVRVTYVHPFDETLAIQLSEDSALNGGAAGSATNFDELNTQLTTNAVAVEVFLANSRGNAPSGTLDALFDVTASPNYYGVRRRRTADGEDNYDPKNRVLIPIRIDASAGGADVPLTADHFRRVGESAGFQMGAFDANVNMAQVMTRFEYRQIASFVDAEGIKVTPALESEVGRKLNKAFGFNGFILHDPTLGSQMIAVDDLATPGKIDFLNTSQWEQASPIGGGFEMFPGEIAGIWSRNTEQSGSGRPGKTYSANGLLLAAFVCRWPPGQIRLEGLATT